MLAHPGCSGTPVGAPGLSDGLPADISPARLSLPAQWVWASRSDGERTPSRSPELGGRLCEALGLRRGKTHTSHSLSVQQPKPRHPQRLFPQPRGQERGWSRAWENAQVCRCPRGRSSPARGLRARGGCSVRVGQRPLDHPWTRGRLPTLGEQVGLVEPPRWRAESGKGWRGLACAGSGVWTQRPDWSWPCR